MLKTVGDRAFSVGCPHEWNRLLGEIRDCQILGAFKKAEDPPVQGCLWSLVCLADSI